MRKNNLCTKSMHFRDMVARKIFSIERMGESSMHHIVSELVTSFILQQIKVKELTNEIMYNKYKNI